MYAQALYELVHIHIPVYIYVYMYVLSYIHTYIYIYIYRLVYTDAKIEFCVRSQSMHDALASARSIVLLFYCVRQAVARFTWPLLCPSALNFFTREDRDSTGPTKTYHYITRFVGQYMGIYTIHISMLVVLFYGASVGSCAYAVSAYSTPWRWERDQRELRGQSARNKRKEMRERERESERESEEREEREGQRSE